MEKFTEGRVKIARKGHAAFSAASRNIVGKPNISDFLPRLVRLDAYSQSLTASEDVFMNEGCSAADWVGGRGLLLFEKHISTFSH